MLNKLLTLVSLCCALAYSNNLLAQAGSYSFAVSTGTYTPLGASATAVPDLLADGGEDDIEIGFDFEFEGVLYDSVAATSDGFLSFVLGASSTLTNDLDNGPSSRRPLVAPLWDDHDGNASSSAALYEVSGTAPNRVFTFEWRDWEWSYNSTDSVVSFQVKLYETSNVIEFTYRWESATSITSPDASIGISGAATFLSVTDISTGSPVASNSAENSSIDTIVTDQVFTFTPPACPAPSALMDSNITMTSMDLGWQSSGSGPWYIYWGECGFNQASPSVALDTATVTSITVTGLSPGTNYEFYVFEDCGAAGFSDSLHTACIMTPCIKQNLPYSENFNSNMGCFTVLDSGSTTHTWAQVPVYGTNDLDGTGFIFADSDGAGSGVNMNEYFVSPPIDAGSLTGSLILEFDQYYNALGDNADVEVWDGTQWITVLSQTSDMGAWGSPDHQFLDVTPYANTDFQVRFHYYNANWAWYWAVDNFSVKEILCNFSSNVQAYASSSDSISISWTPGGGVNFGIEYGITGFTPGSGLMGSTVDTFFTVNGLTANTFYDFYLTDTCTAGFSTTVGPITIKTPCNILTAPFHESFEVSSPSVDCWQNETVAGTQTWSVGTGSSGGAITAAQTGSNNILFTSSFGGPHVTKYISPAIDISSLPNGGQLTFYYGQEAWFSDQNKLRVYAKGINDASWTLLFQDDQNQASWVFEEVSIPSILGDTVLIAFEGEDNYGRANVIDNVSIVDGPTCPELTGLNAHSIVDTGAVFNWTASPVAGSYEVWFGPQGFYQGTATLGGVKIIAPYDSLIVDTLSQLTCYEYIVRAICSPGDSSNWAGPFSFCTLATCPSPDSLGVVAGSITINGADIYWKPGGFATNYNIQYGPIGFAPGTGTIVSASNDTTSLTGLLSGTEYEFYVRDSCGVGDVSIWVGPVSFTTAFTTNYINDFNISGTPFGWTEANGRLSASTAFTSTFSGWGTDDFGNVGSNSPSQRVNIWASNQFQWLISPSIYLDPAITNLQVEFDAAITAYASASQGYFNGTDDTLAVVISTDNGASWSSSNIIWYADANDTIDATGEHIIVPLTGYTGYVKLGIYAGSVVDDSPDNDIFIDNFEVRIPAACVDPTGLAVTDVTTDSALVYWTPGDIAAIGWEVIYTLGNQPASSGTVVPGTNDSLFLTGLSDATSYCVYLVEQCTNGYSDTIGPICFSTMCLKQSLPYLETFSNDMGCFTAVDSTIDPSTWMWLSLYSGFDNLDGSPGFMMVDSDGAGSGIDMDEYAYSPEIDASTLAANDSLFITFEQYWRTYLFGGSEVGDVDVFDGTNWITVFSQNQATGDLGNWGAPDSVKINITAYAHADLQVRFHYYDANFDYWWAVDNFSVYKENFACPGPQSPAVNIAACDSVEISWTSGTATTSTTMEYGPAGYPPGTGTVVSGISSPYTLSGLALDTEYDVYLMDSCGTDFSMPVGPITFQTDSVGPVLASFTAVQTGATLVDGTVDVDATASTGDGLTYSWDFDNGSSGTGVTTSATYTANGVFNIILTVTDRCGNTDDTTIAVTVSEISIVENKYNAEIQMYPNPSNGVFRVNVSNGITSYSIEVSDLSGKVVYRKDNIPTGTEQHIDLGNKASGVYLVRFIGEGLNVSQRLMVD